MRTKEKSSGFAVVELVLIVVVLAVAGFTGWWVYQRQQGITVSSPAATALNDTSPVATNVSSAPTIQSSNDLNSALQVLNQNDPSAGNSSDITQLNTQASGF
jgi:predicted negative regulator of RcsB-dependent stress response